MMKKTSAIVVYAEKPRLPSGCEIYRGNMPMHYLSKTNMWEGQWVWLEDIWNQCQVFGKSASDAFINSADIFIFPRLFLSDRQAHLQYGSLFTLLRESGKKIVYEVDDDLTNEHRRVVEGDAITPMTWADAIIVTTPYLQKIVRKVSNRPTYVIPNNISPEVWSDGVVKRPAEFTDKVIIGLTGSTTHAHDWDVLAPVIPKLLEDNPNIHFILMGYHPDYLSNLPNTSYIPAVDYIRYAQIIRMCDIILAPVSPDDGFNLGKSPIKVIEGMAAARMQDPKPVGAAVIATDNPIYRLAVQHEKTGLLTDHTSESWRNAIQRLLDDVPLRQKLQTEGFKWVYKHHNMASEWRQWAQTFQKILAAPVNPLPIPL